MLPITPNGEFDMGPHMAWMESRRRIDQKWIMAKLVAYPTTTNHNSNNNYSNTIMTLDQHPLEPSQQQQWQAPAISTASSTSFSLLNSWNHENYQIPQPVQSQNGNRNYNHNHLALLTLRNSEMFSPTAPRSMSPSSISSGGGGSGGSVGGDVSIIMLPRPQDVLFGNLKETQTQQGNAILRDMIEMAWPEYQQVATKSEKMQISRSIVSQIKADHGGRFLKQTARKYSKDGRVMQKNFSTATVGWIEVKDHVARDKIGHAFRKLRLRKQSQQSQQSQAQAPSSSASIGSGDRPTRPSAYASADIGGESEDWVGCLGASCGSGRSAFSFSSASAS
jgi:hypothetical protein